MPAPTYSPENEARIREAKRLILGACNIIADSSFPESAIWRLIDAAGLIVETLPPEKRHRLCGLGSESTGRGYRLLEPEEPAHTPTSPLLTPPPRSIP